MMNIELEQILLLNWLFFAILILFTIIDLFTIRELRLFDLIVIGIIGEQLCFTTWLYSDIYEKEK